MKRDDKLIELLGTISKSVGHVITYIEIPPCQLRGDIHVTAIKREFSSMDKCSLRVEKLKKVKYDNEKFIYVPQGDDTPLWLPSTMINGGNYKKVASVIKSTTLKEREFYLVRLSYIDENIKSNSVTLENKIFLSRKNAVHDVIAYRNAENITSLISHVTLFVNEASPSKDKCDLRVKGGYKSPLSKDGTKALPSPSKEKPFSAMELMAAPIFD